MKNLIKLMKARHDFYVKYPELGATHLHLLERIGMRDGENKPLTVTEAMKLATVASPATIHRLMDDLEFVGFIRKFHARGNIRTKYLILGKKGWMYFRKVAKEMS